MSLVVWVIVLPISSLSSPALAQVPDAPVAAPFPLWPDYVVPQPTPVFTAKCRLCGSAISAFLTHAQNLCRQFKCLRSSEFGMLLALLSMGKEKRVFRLLMNLCFDPHLGSHCETLSFQNVCELP